MNTNNINFFSENNRTFVKELNAEVKKYFSDNNISKYGNISIVFKTILMAILYALPYFLMVFGIINSLSIMFFMWFIMGLGMAGLGMVIMHDANHGTLSKNKHNNFWFSKVLYALGGFPPNWRQQHNVMHHKYTNIDGYDEDINPINILRFSPHKPLKKIHKYQHIYAWFFYGLMTFSWSTNKDFRQLSDYKKSGIRLDRNTNYRKLFIDLIIAKILYYFVLLVIPIIFTSFQWYLVVLGFLLMHFVSGFSLGVIFQTAHVMPTTDYPVPEKDGNIDNLWAVHQLQTTSNYAPKNKVLNWLIGGLNFQVEHHLFPNISHIHYSRISVIVKKKAKEYNLPYNIEPSFWTAVFNHYKMLKSLGRA